jgi:sugar O-acyltransferase (sialic acid O-acetyltransferase NeuD family)
MQTQPAATRHYLQTGSRGERVVIVGTGEQAAIAYEYLTHDSPHEVVAFSAESGFLGPGVYCGLPVVPLDQLAAAYPPTAYRAFVAVSATHLNHLRRRLLDAVKGAGFRCISYVSNHAFVWHNVEIGENTFVFENCVLQHRARIGDNVILWSGAFVAHQTVIEDDCCVSAQAAIAGFCRVGYSSFIGIGSCVADTVSVAPECIVGAGAVVIRDTEPRQVYVGSPARATGRDSFETFRVPDGENGPPMRVKSPGREGASPTLGQR